MNIKVGDEILYNEDDIEERGKVLEIKDDLYFVINDDTDMFWISADQIISEE